MSYFPRLLGGSTNWLDFSENLVNDFDLGLERLYLTLKKRESLTTMKMSNLSLF